MNKPKVDDVIILELAPTVSPKYLNGAHVKITAATPRGFDGEIVQTGPGPKKSHRNRVGARIRGLQVEMIGHVFEVA